MQLRRLAVLALAVAVAACSSDAGDSPPDPASAVLKIVSGDGQRAPVASSAPSPVSGPMRANGALPGGPPTEDDLFPEPLRVRAVVSDAGPSASVVGPSFSITGTPVPGVTVTWRTRPEGRSCGYPVEVSTITDAEGESINRWRRGTWAGECYMDVCRVNRDTGAVVCDSTFTAVQEPGPPVGAVTTGHVRGLASIGDTIDLRPYIEYGEDAYRNRIDAETIRALPDSAVTWAWKASRLAPEDIHGDGWLVVVPDAVALGYWHYVRGAEVQCWALEAYILPSINGGPVSGLVVDIEVPEGAEPPDDRPVCRAD